MAKLQELMKEVKDTSDYYDGVVFICTKGNSIASLGFAGSMPLAPMLPPSAAQQRFVFDRLAEASYAVAFGEPKKQDEG